MLYNLIEDNKAEDNAHASADSVNASADARLYVALRIPAAIPPSCAAWRWFGREAVIPIGAVIFFAVVIIIAVIV